MSGEALAIAATGTARRDQTERLGALFDAHHQRLYRLARRLSGSADAARDLVQETFLRAARRCRTACPARGLAGQGPHQHLPRPARVNASVRLAELNREIGDIEGKVRAMGKRGGGQIISTTFSMDIGETVVVGTSRLRGGDKALIALLTAVPKK